MKSLKVIKIGGKVLANAELLEGFLSAFINIDDPKILVHGGGNEAKTLAEELGVDVKYIDGRRVTSAKDLEIVTMVYAGSINKKLSATLNARGCKAIGISGADAHLIRTVKRPAKPIDFGYVGDLVDDSVDGNLIRQFLEMGITPVIAPVTSDKNGQLLNVNADTIAAAIAVEMSTHYNTCLILSFEQKGVWTNASGESIFEEMTPGIYERAKESGALSGGILPKLTNAFDAIERGVDHVRLCHATRVDQEEGTVIKH